MNRGASLAFALCTLLMGCAGAGAQRLATVQAQSTGNVVAGKSTKADVLALLGRSASVAFDSGYEVWAYQVGSREAAEFVILFAPSGIVARTRTRPAPPGP